MSWASVVIPLSVIMHNIIIENDRKTRARHIGPYECMVLLRRLIISACRVCWFPAMHAEICDTTVHAQVQRDLVEHLWRLKGEASTASVPWSSSTYICLMCCLLTFYFETFLWSLEIFICMLYSKPKKIESTLGGRGWVVTHPKNGNIQWYPLF
jgi:hypothetical protein